MTKWDITFSPWHHPKVEKLLEKRDTRRLIKLLRDRDVDLRESAARALYLGRITDSRAAEPLIAILQSADDDKVKASAAAALGIQEDPRAIGPLSATLGHSGLGLPEIARLTTTARANRSTLQNATASALAGFGEVSIEPLLGALNQLIANGDCTGAIAYVARAFRHVGDRRAVDGLWRELGDERAIGPLIAAFPRLSVLRDPFHALGGVLTKFGAPAVEPLIQALGDETLVDMAVLVLGEIGDPRAVEPLVAVVTDSRANRAHCRPAPALSLRHGWALRVVNFWSTSRGKQAQIAAKRRALEPAWLRRTAKDRKVSQRFSPKTTKRRL